MQSSGGGFRWSVLLLLVLGPGLTASALAGGGLARGVNARPTSDFGLDFARINKPGNRAALPEERYYNLRFENLGRVNYRYRISKTEVTAAQWLDFVNAYDPYWIAAGNTRFGTALSSQWIRPANHDPSQPGDYYIVDGAANRAITTEWRIAARFVNWLHNGMVNEQWAFDTGVYDAASFGGNAQDGYTDQAERSPGARFWLPSVDEWTKAAHYDPDRYGEGQEGYWLRMGGQDAPLTPGLPEDGGQTSGGDFLPGFDEQFLDVGLYTNIDGPWGLLDTSGGVREWTETVWGYYPGGEVHTGERFIRGSGAGNSFYLAHDLIDRADAGLPGLQTFGVRLASAIPSPGSPILFLSIAGLRLASRRRRL